MSERLAITLGRFKHSGRTFEIIVDPQKAFEYLETGAVDIDDILTAPEVYADAQNGELAKETDLKQVFGSTDVTLVAKRIMQDGEVQLSAEQRAFIRERMHRRVIDTIARRGIDPRTGNPHPIARIEAALDEVKFRIRESITVEKNVVDAISAIRTVLPIKVEMKTYEVTAQPHHAGKVLAIAGRIGEIKHQSWGAQGSLTITLEIPAGMRDELYSKLNDATGADIEITTK